MKATIRGCVFAAVVLLCIPAFIAGQGIDIEQFKETLEAKFDPIHKGCERISNKRTHFRFLPDVSMSDVIRNGGSMPVEISDEDSEQKIQLVARVSGDYDYPFSESSDSISMLMNFDTKNYRRDYVAGNEVVSSTARPADKKVRTLVTIVSNDGKKMLEGFEVEAANLAASNAAPFAPDPYYHLWTLHNSVESASRMENVDGYLTIEVPIDSGRQSVVFVLDESRNMRKWVSMNGRRIAEVINWYDYQDYEGVSYPTRATRERYDEFGYTTVSMEIFEEIKYEKLSNEDCKNAMNLDFPEGTITENLSAETESLRQETFTDPWVVTEMDFMVSDKE